MSKDDYIFDDWLDSITVYDNTNGKLMMDLGYAIFERHLRDVYLREKRVVKCKFCDDTVVFHAVVFETKTIEDEEETAKQKADKGLRSKSEQKKKDAEDAANREVKTETITVRRMYRCDCMAARRPGVVERLSPIGVAMKGTFECASCRKAMFVKTYEDLRIVNKQLVCWDCDKSERKSDLHLKMLKLASKLQPPIVEEVQAELEKIRKSIGRVYDPEKFPLDPWELLRERMIEGAKEMRMLK